MPKKTPSFKTVLVMGVIIGLAVIVVAIIAIHLQQRRTLLASVEGTLPRMEEKSGWQALSADPEGEHHFVAETHPGASAEVVGAWDRLTYSGQGRDNYILKRRKNGMFVTGMDKLRYRYILYDLKCAATPRQYAIMKVFEVADSGRTLDYGKAGSQKEWEDIPAGTALDGLAKAACR